MITQNVTYSLRQLGSQFDQLLCTIIWHESVCVTGCRYDNILAWQFDREANSSMPLDQLPEILKPRPMDTMRPLYAGLDVMLNLLFRRLAYDPSQPNAPFSYDACLRVMKRQDKEMGS